MRVKSKFYSNFNIFSFNQEYLYVYISILEKSYHTDYNPTVEKVIVEYISNIEPLYASENASGADLFADITETLTLNPGCFKLIPTGLKIAIPVNYEGQIRPRSGLALEHGITVLNTPGTIDADYRGEIKVLLINLGSMDVLLEPKDRIAQLVISPIVRADFCKVSQLQNTKRGDKGYGSTGIK